jgi:hypothetical protein
VKIDFYFYAISVVNRKVRKSELNIIHVKSSRKNRFFIIFYKVCICFKVCQKCQKKKLRKMKKKGKETIILLSGKAIKSHFHVFFFHLSLLRRTFTWKINFLFLCLNLTQCHFFFFSLDFYSNHKRDQKTQVLVKNNTLQAS